MDRTDATTTLRARLTNPHADPQPITLQHLGFSDAELDVLPWVLEGVRDRLGVELQLSAATGDIVLVETGFGQRVAPQVLQAFLEGRPMLTLAAASATGGTLATRKGVLDGCAQLVEQLRALTLPRGGAGADGGAAAADTGSGFDSQWDTGIEISDARWPELDEDRQHMLTLLRMGMLDPSAPPLVLSYGSVATLRVDFATGRVTIDRDALQRLRAAAELPQLAPGRRPQPEAVLRELDLLVWDLGLAAGGYRLLHAPKDWWHHPLMTPPLASVVRYTRDPKHLEMARTLFSAPVTASALRREARVGISDLRAFLQACLFLGLAYWAPRAQD